LYLRAAPATVKVGGLARIGKRDADENLPEDRHFRFAFPAGNFVFTGCVSMAFAAVRLPPIEPFAGDEKPLSVLCFPLLKIC
jgi:hypothetical protein